MDTAVCQGKSICDCRGMHGPRVYSCNSNQATKSSPACPTTPVRPILRKATQSSSHVFIVNATKSARRHLSILTSTATQSTTGTANKSAQRGRGAEQHGELRHACAGATRSRTVRRQSATLPHAEGHNIQARPAPSPVYCRERGRVQLLVPCGNKETQRVGSTSLPRPRCCL